MKDLAARLQDAGAVGVSVGILYQNQAIHTAGFGYRNVARELPPDEHTIYHIASLSKAFTSAAVSILVNDKKVDWNNPVAQILPQYTHYDPSIRSEATLLDHLSHRTCLAQKGALWIQDGADLLLGPEELFRMISYTENVHPLRSQWLYSNWGYCIGASVIEKLTSKTWADFLTKSLFEPLGLKNTSTKIYPDGENVAQPYLAFPDGSSFPVEPPGLVAGSIMQGASAVTSSVSDLLVFYQALLAAWKSQLATNSTSTPGSPLKDVCMSLEGHIPLELNSSYQQSYGIGWAISELPAPLGQIGINGMFVPTMPIVGKGSKKRIVWHHNGSLAGFFSSVHILPDSDTAIIVLTNSMANNDCADWIGQFLLETVLDNPDKNDYVKLAVESADRYRAMWREVKDELDKGKIPDTTARPLENYVGKYYNKIRDWFLDVELVDGQLVFKFQGWPSETHKLKHYHHDTFCWLITPEESIRRGRWSDLSASVYLFHFGIEHSQEIRTIKWEHDFAVPEGETFTRTSSTSDVQNQKALNIDVDR